MGVPISFLEKMNDKQFQLVGFRKGDDGKDVTYRHTYRQTDRQTDRQTGRQVQPFTRVFIRKL